MHDDWTQTLPADRLIAEVSLWSAGLGRLEEDIARLNPHADIWHVDACDGHFAPQLLIFPDMVAVLRKATKRPIHVHLMVQAPILLAQIEQFAEVGADLLSLHAETDQATLEQGFERVARLGLSAGLVLTLDTPTDRIAPYLGQVDFVTLVGTRIGIKGVQPDAHTYRRLGEARALIDGSGKDRRTILAADGGIRDHTVPEMRAAGADTVVMGSLAFGDPDLPARMRWLHGL